MADGEAAEAPKVDVDEAAPAADETQESKKSFGGPRKRLMWGRIFLGQVLDWKGKYGWILPVEPILHQKANLRQGRLFVSRTDLVGSRDLLPGVMVQFQVYEDESGLGAQNCTIWDPMMPFKGGWMPGKGFGKKSKSKGKPSKEPTEDGKGSTSPAADSPGVSPGGAAAPAAPPSAQAKAPQPKAPQQAKAGKGEGEAKGKGKGGRGKDPAKKGEGGGKQQAGKSSKGREKGGKDGKGKDDKGKGRGGNDRNAPGRFDRPAGPGTGLASPKLAGYPPAAGLAPSAASVAGAPCGLTSSAPRNLAMPASAQEPPLPKMGRGLGLPVPGPVPGFLEGSGLNSMPQNLNLAGLQGLQGLNGLPGLQGLQQSLGLGNPPWAGFMPPPPQMGPGAGLGAPPYPDLPDLHSLRAGVVPPPFRGGLADPSFLT